MRIGERILFAKFTGRSSRDYYDPEITGLWIIIIGHYSESLLKKFESFLLTVLEFQSNHPLE